jgi:hypothetical protein
MIWRGLVLLDLEKGLVLVFFVYGNESFVSIKRNKFLDYVSKC